ncbi:MAG TPA: error-prone DNA polymerase [Verrucomicrobiae bacterium]|nr:error-prone DNA polymerase [Verrucomicrobiae bacterium]
MTESDYIELHCRSAFSFLRGGSLPEQLAEDAPGMGLPAMALLDRDGVYGAPRFFFKAKETGLRAIIGVELTMEDGSILPLLAKNRTGYQNICRLTTRAHLRSEKGKAAVWWHELPEFAGGLVALTGDDEGPIARAFAVGHNVTANDRLNRLVETFGREDVYVELQRHHRRGEDRLNSFLIALADQAHLELLATNGVCYARPNGRQILDVFTCIRNHTHLDAAGLLLSQNSERHLKTPAEMRDLFADMPEAIRNTVRLAERLEFSLDNLGYEFPKYPMPDGETMDHVLRQQVYAGATHRYGARLSGEVRAQLDRELNLIAQLGFAGYFLIVGDLVKFCRANNVMAQGRGSAANSAVCYCLGITAVDPVGCKLLFERFLSESRKSWPDIDIDLPSGDRRERVIQEVYQRYGQHGAAMTANVITFRGRSAAREIGKALNIAPDVLDRFSNLFANGDFPHTLDLPAQMEKSGLPKEHPRAPAFASLYQAMYALPRHLGQHSGGMIISQGKLDSIVPLENASMPGRVVAQWDKDDCEELGIIKVDLLGLGMMSVLQDAVELCSQRGHPIDIAQIPTDDKATYEMMQKADTIGVFQIESRAQMATLPRMKPDCFYDVVIEVAIIRPGPIQGHLMHPYLARRQGKEPIAYYDPALEPVLARTLGVPLFQEQMLKIAMVMADFTGSEAEELRRALSFHRSEEKMNKVKAKLERAMECKNIPPLVATQVIDAIGSFALYGFPESHAISFAILAYASAWLKTHRAAEFYASLLNNQPMGFYSPATIVKDARRHGIHFKPIDITISDWNYTIEADDTLRIGLRAVEGLRHAQGQYVLEQRAKRSFQSLDDFKRRSRLHKDELRTLAEVGALNAFADHRRAALWEVEKSLPADDELFFEIDRTSSSPSLVLNDSPLPHMSDVERLAADYSGLSLTIGPHPMTFLRPHLENVWRAVDLPNGEHGQTVRIAGNVICRQRPGTAKGFVFISLEDETGVSNAIVTPQLFEKLRLTITQESFLLIEGRLQTTDGVYVIQARHIERLDHGQLQGAASYDFH